jgi:hypothetical protein
MLSRLFWIGLTGIALIAGIAWHSGHSPMTWEENAERTVDQRVETAIDRGVAKMEVTGADGEAIEVPPEDKKALADAIGRLVKAETELAILRVRDGSEKEIAAADSRRDQAKDDVEAIKDRIEGQKQLADNRRHELRDQIRDDVRKSVREAVRN